MDHLKTLNEEVTLVIPAHGRPEMTHRLLESLRKAGAGYQIILVDDATPEPLLDDPKHIQGLRLCILRNSTRVGPAASRNIGIGSATTRFVAFTDNDVEVSAEWLVRLHQHLAEAPKDVAGVGGRVLDDGSNLVGRYSTRFHLLDPHVHQGRVMYLVTANCLIRRDCILKVGGFNESFDTPGGEDPELSFRLLKAGYRLEFNREAVVVHHYESSWLKFFRLFQRYGRGCRKAMNVLAFPHKNSPEH